MTNARYRTRTSACGYAYTLHAHTRTHTHLLHDTHTHLSNKFTVGAWLVRLTLINYMPRTAERERVEGGEGRERKGGETMVKERGGGR